MEVLPDDIFDDIILQFMELDLDQMSMLRDFTPGSHQTYLNYLDDNILMLVQDQEPWMIAIENDDTILMERLLEAFHQGKLRVAIRYDDDLYQEVVVNTLYLLDQHLGLNISRMMRVMEDYDAKEVYALLLRDPTFGKAISELMNDGYFLDMGMTLSGTNYDTMRSTIEVVMDDQTYIRLILFYAAHQGIEELNVVLHILSDMKTYIDRQVIDSVIGGLSDHDDIQEIDLILSYPFIHE